MTRKSLIAGLVGLGIAIGWGSPAMADPGSFLTDEIAACQAKLDSATTDPQRQRATDCLEDARRALEWLNRPTPTPTPSSTPTATATPTGTPSPTTTSSSQSSTPVPTTSTTTSSPPPVQEFPNPTNSGVPPFWIPNSTRTSSLRVTTAGAVIENVRFDNGADLIVDAPNVTVRRVVFNGGNVDNRPGSTCRNGLRIEQATFNRPTTTGNNDPPAIGTGGFTLDRVEVLGYAEGVRVGGRSSGGCGPVTITNSFIHVQSPTNCGDWHGDGIQGNDGPALTVRNVTIDLEERSGCGGTAPFFYPHSQGNTSVNVDRLLVKGGGFTYRDGMPGPVTNLNIVDGSFYGPINVKCSVKSQWSARIVRIDSNYQISQVLRSQACNTEAGN